MPCPDNPEAPDWRDLCAKLQAQNDPVRFQAVVAEIDRLLTAYEKKQGPPRNFPQRKRFPGSAHKGLQYGNE